MAGIDKIYGNLAQYDELREWIKNNRKRYLRYFYVRWDEDWSKEHEICPIANFSTNADMWLYFNCPIKWLRERIYEQYNLEKYETRK